MINVWAWTTLIMVSVSCSYLVASPIKPTVDRGLIMIFGVQSCRNGEGYCLLGLDCTLDDDFIADDSQGHCNGLKKAFTPVAHFTCCQVVPGQTPKRKTRPPIAVTTAAPKPTVSSNSTLLNTVPEDNETTTSKGTTTIEEITTSYTGLLIEEATTLEMRTEGNVFVDLNNEVLKEVTPPVLVIPKPD